MDAPTGAVCYIFECIEVLCYGWTLPQGLLVFFNKSCVTGGRPRRGFLFSSKHCLIFLSVYKSCVMGGRSHLFSSKTHSYVLSVYNSCVMGGRSRGGLNKKHCLVGWVYTSLVLWVGAPAGPFFRKKHRLIFLRVYKSCVTGGRSRRVLFFHKNIVTFCLCIQVPCYGWTLLQGLFCSSKTQTNIVECIQVLCYGWTLPQGLFVFF